ncbi:MAG: dienelactone hydrolase family protein [Pseudomonadota bacterium]|jgi:dienelactone hydrolase
MKFFAALFISFVTVSGASAGVITSFVDYRHGDTELKGYLAYDDAIKGQRPGVLVVHDWMGEGPFDRAVSEKLARLGYIAFAADIYGSGVRPKDSKEAAAQAGIYRKDRVLMRSRANAALQVLLENEMADSARVAAMGYCFGGGVTLELARSGAPLAGAVSFHGNLDTPDPSDAENIKAKVLVMHGADDPFVPMDQVLAFMEEMRQAKVDWQFIAYGNAVHSFTNPAAGNDNSQGAAYNGKADRRSWRAMQVFFNEIFGN